MAVAAYTPVLARLEGLDSKLTGKCVSRRFDSVFCALIGHWSVISVMTDHSVTALLQVVSLVLRLHHKLWIN
jgi:hypothetical protein